MKNNSTQLVNLLAQDAEVLDFNQFENFDQNEFQDVLRKLDELKLSVRPHVLEKVMKFARSN